MLSRHQQPLAAALFALDGLIVFGAWLLAYALRFAPGFPAPFGVPPPERYVWAGAVVTLAAMLTFRALDLYRSARAARLAREQITLLKGVALTSAAAALLSFALRGELSRLVLLLFTAIAALALCASRLVIRGVLRSLRRRGRNLRHVIIVGTGPTATALARQMTARPEFGYAVAGLVASTPARTMAEAGAAPVIGALDQLPALIERSGAELVYLALERDEGEAESAALDRLQDSTASVRLVPDLSRAFTLNAGVEDFDGTPVILVTEQPGQGWNALIKRSFDLVVAAVALLLLSPVMIVIALWVKLDSPGPALIAQERVGLNGLRFPLLKFRTMNADAENETGPAWSRRDDPRRTRAGRVLRRLSLDELPQLLNVLAGQMSLVGPRPERPPFVEQFRASVPRYMLRHHVKAGLTGWAQVNGLRGDTALDRRIEHDLFYIRNWSLAFDLKILALTLVRVFHDASAQ